MRADGAAAVPVRRWQRVQWQYPAETSGSVTSKRTPPHMQPPVRGSEAIAATLAGVSLLRGMRDSPFPRMVRPSGSSTRERTAVLHWDVKRVVTLLALLALVAIAASGGCLSWSDMSWYDGIFW